jgi:NADH:ubiquinone oxidoreductase subunit K
VAGLAAFVFHYFAPDFPFDEVLILAAIVFVLGLFGITPELRQRGLIR